MITLEQLRERPMTAPNWLLEAHQALGLAEVPGVKTSPVINRWLQRLKAWWADDETPWCGVFVAQCFERFDYPLPSYWMRARAWLAWGIPLTRPVVGCVVVFERKGGGHVGFVVGQDSIGRLLVLGGNQGNKVSIAPFERDRVLGYRWPDSDKSLAPTFFSPELPILTARGLSSINEA